MGSLKRKNASLGGSAASSKRATRDDTSSAFANGYTGRRAANVQSVSSSSSMAPLLPAVGALCNGESASGKTSEDPCPSTTFTSPLPASLENLTISEVDPAHPANSKEQETDAVVAGPDSSHTQKLGLLTPNHAGWFSWNSIHAVEQRGLPEFFNSKSKLKTPTVYMDYRNLLMKKYLENPDKLFTLDDVSSAILDQKGGLLEAAKHIFEFLNHWGLLNARAFEPAETERPVKPKATAFEDNSGQSQWSLTSSLYRFNTPTTLPSSRTSTSLVPAATMTEATVADLQGGVQGMGVGYHCNSCSADCSKRRFHCQKQADFDLCPECYNEGKFSFGITSTDFILMEAVTDAANSGGWSDQETLLLLEALEMFGDNFSEIAEHVGTKTKTQCILHFIRLPIEDPFLEVTEPNNTIVQPLTTESVGNSKSSNLGSQGDELEETGKIPPSNDPLQHSESTPISGNAHHIERNDDHIEPIDDGNTEVQDSSAREAIISAAEAAGLVTSEKFLPLSECGNPVMTLVSFLAALVEPDVVATSAQAALKVLADHASALQLADAHSFHLELESPGNDASNNLEATDRFDRGVEENGQSNDTHEMPDDGGDPNQEGDLGSHVINAVDKEGSAAVAAVHDSTGPPTKVSSSLEKVTNAATTALAAAAVKAKFLADQEEWEILRLAAFVVDSQTKKIETKLKLFKDLDAALEKEHGLLERSRQRLFVERAQIAATHAVQSAALGHYKGMNVPTPGGGPRQPHSMTRLPAAFAPVPMLIHSGPLLPLKEPRGANLVPTRPVQCSNTQL